MRVWLFKVHEAIPISGQSNRLYRMGILAKHLSQQPGNDVTWFNSRFDHNLKRQRNEASPVTFNESLKVELLEGRSYKKSLSFQRFQNENDMSRHFKTLVNGLDKKKYPDIIVTAMPSLSLADTVVRFAKENNIPVIVDLRDKWPDVWAERLFPLAPFIGKIFFNKQFRQIRYITQNVDGIWGITNAFLDWGLNYAKRTRKQFDKVFHLIGEPLAHTVKDDKLAEKLEPLIKGKRVFTYCGTISKSFEFEYLIAEIQKCKSDDFVVLVAGSGDDLEIVRKKAEKVSDKVHFLGWLNKTEISQLYQLSDFGLAHYVNRSDFQMSIPNKIIEYLSFNLPIVYSLKGETDRFLDKNQCGLYFDTKVKKSLAVILANANKSSFDSMKIESTFNQYFSFDRTYNEMRECLESLVKDRRS